MEYLARNLGIAYKLEKEMTSGNGTSAIVLNFLYRSNNRMSFPPQREVTE